VRSQSQRHTRVTAHLLQRDVAVSAAFVVDDVFEHAVHVWHLELQREVALAVVLQRHTVVGVQHDKGQLHVVRPAQVTG
jgi:hypothetical protein